MKKLMRALAVVGLGAVIAAPTYAAMSDEDIKARIKPIGEVCLEGQACGAGAAVAAAPAGARSGEDVYKSSCFACHGAGVAGAPKFGDAGAWAGRLSQGMDQVIANAINGVRAMPPRGTCASCSDEEISNAVNYMVENSK